MSAAHALKALKSRIEDRAHRRLGVIGSYAVKDAIVCLRDVCSSIHRSGRDTRHRATMRRLQPMTDNRLEGLWRTYRRELATGVNIVGSDSVFLQYP